MEKCPRPPTGAPEKFSDSDERLVIEIEEDIHDDKSPHVVPLHTDVSALPKLRARERYSKFRDGRPQGS